MARARGGVSGAGLRRGLICSNCSGPVSVLTFDTFQQRTEAEAEWLKAGGPYRDAEFGKAEVGNGRADYTRRRTEPGRVRTGVIGNKRTGVMGYSSEHYVLEKCEPYGRDDSICNVGAERAIYGERTVRAVRHQPQDRL